MTSGWLVRFADGRVFTRDQMAKLGTDYFNGINRGLIASFAILVGGRVAWETPEAPLTYRYRTQMKPGGAKRIIQMAIFPDRIVWVFETGEIVVGPGFGDKEPFGSIDPVNEREHAVIAHHLASPRRSMNFVPARV